MTIDCNFRDFTDHPIGIPLGRHTKPSNVTPFMLSDKWDASVTSSFTCAKNSMRSVIHQHPFMASIHGIHSWKFMVRKLIYEWNMDFDLQALHVESPGGIRARLCSCCVSSTMSLGNRMVFTQEKLGHLIQ